MPESNKHKNDNYFDCEPDYQQLSHSVPSYPVVLAEVYLQKDIFHVTTFPELVLEIKDSRKRLVITQCRLLLPTNKLFIKGYVRKNIRYAAADSPLPESFTTTLKSKTEFIKFEMVEEIKEFITKPLLPKKNSRQEFEFSVSHPMPLGFPEKDEMHSSDLSQFHQESNQFYNELPYCELISSNITEWDAAVEPITTVTIEDSSRIPIQETFFQTIENKIVINFKIQILQNQQISISANAHENNCN
ncbi:CsxC family protein [Niallia endozanthoxylica]|uniref:DUF3794 domain-containing protein n=1 Tax=Niallia endozanthoxylica TaxID=2036016 RepID=A0A5J5I003_9BACI|nr:DUF3794 domain-containing protein [Niallia endozanthoxylica]KAA9028488.1 DUF3794 domain-containing protein [Niallia endozanthoxylica]